MNLFWRVAASGLWIAGLSVLLAAVSWARWLASVERSSLRAALRQSGVRRTLAVGLVLFCAGMAATSRAWWESVLWGALGLFWVVRAWQKGISR